jgi:hypothetical protein
MKLKLFVRPELITFLFTLSVLFSCSKKSGSGSENTAAITGFSADTVYVGKTITINGNGFSASAKDNSVRIGSTIVSEVLEATETALTIKIPAGATSAKVHVSVNGKEMASSGALVVVNQFFWQKLYGGMRDEHGMAVAPVAGGGYLIAGTSESTDGDVGRNNGLTDMWVVKLNADRSIAWQKVFGGSGSDGATSIAALADGSCVVAGYTSSTNGDGTGNHGSTDYFIYKLDAGGNVVWKRILGGTAGDMANAVIATSNGFVVAGYSSSTNGDVTGNHGLSDYWIVWLDANGTLIRQRSYGGYDYDQANSITSTADGGYMVAGGTMSTDGDVTGNNGSYDYWILKLNATGDIEWQKSYGGSGSDKPQSIAAAKDGGYYIAGNSNSNNGDVTGNHGNDDYWVVKLNANGNIAWQRSLGGSLLDHGLAVVATKDGGCAVAGLGTSVDGDLTGNHGKSESWIVRLDAKGSLVWQRACGGKNSETGSALISTGSSFTVLGYSNSSDGDVSGLHGTTRLDFWLYQIFD